MNSLFSKYNFYKPRQQVHNSHGHQGPYVKNFSAKSDPSTSINLWVGDNSSFKEIATRTGNSIQVHSIHRDYWEVLP